MVGLVEKAEDYQMLDIFLAGIRRVKGPCQMRGIRYPLAQCFARQ